MFSMLIMLFALGTAEAKPVDKFCDTRTVDQSRVEHIDEEIVVFGVDARKVKFEGVRFLDPSQVVSRLTGEVLAVGGHVYLKDYDDLKGLMQSLTDLTGVRPILAGPKMMVWQSEGVVSMIGKDAEGGTLLVLSCDHLD